MEKVQVRAVIKYLCKKGMTPKEICENFLKTLGNYSPSYSTVIKWVAKWTLVLGRANNSYGYLGYV